MPRLALLRPKTEIWAVTNNLCLELKCSKRKNRAAAKTNFATAPFVGDMIPASDLTAADAAAHTISSE